MSEVQELPSAGPYTYKNAYVSQCGLFRYDLIRKWGEGKRFIVIGLNPSTADAWQDDPTIRREVAFAKREGCGELLKLNLFAYRATDPKDMKGARDPIGPYNDENIKGLFRLAVINEWPVVAAWGAHGSFLDRDKEVGMFADDLGVKLICFGLTKDFKPKHPLYLSKDTPLVDFSDAVNQAFWGHP